MKKAFSMLLTIIFLVVMAFVGTMIMTFSSANVKHASSSIMDIRANLALKSATEYAILALQGHDFSKNLDEINLSYPFFNANIRFHYFLTDTNCSDPSRNCTQIDTKDTNATVLIYVTVTSKIKSFHIRKVRVTLQNP